MLQRGLRVALMATLLRDGDVAVVGAMAESIRVDNDNVAAVATYTAAGGAAPEDCVLIPWTL